MWQKFSTSYIDRYSHLGCRLTLLCTKRYMISFPVSIRVTTPNLLECGPWVFGLHSTYQMTMVDKSNDTVASRMWVTVVFHSQPSLYHTPPLYDPPPCDIYNSYLYQAPVLASKLLLRRATHLLQRRHIVRRCVACVYVHVHLSACVYAHVRLSRVSMSAGALRVSMCAFKKDISWSL